MAFNGHVLEEHEIEYDKRKRNAISAALKNNYLNFQNIQQRCLSIQGV